MINYNSSKEIQIVENGNNRGVRVKNNQLRQR